MVKNAWLSSAGHGESVVGLCNRLREVSKEMQSWSYNTFGSVRREIKKLKVEIEKAKEHALI
jgi:hypothetical protein